MSEDIQGKMPSAPNHLQQGEGDLLVLIYFFSSGVFVVVLFRGDSCPEGGKCWNVPSGCGVLLSPRCQHSAN